MEQYFGSQKISQPIDSKLFINAILPKGENILIEKEGTMTQFAQGLRNNLIIVIALSVRMQSKDAEAEEILTGSISIEEIEGLSDFLLLLFSELELLVLCTCGCLFGCL